MAVEQKTPSRKPPARQSDEATTKQLELAKAEGEAYGRSLDTMVERVAEAGGSTRAGDYVVAWAVEHAEGMYEMNGGTLSWQEPGEANCHVEIAVCDGTDGRFIPGLTVVATLTTAAGAEVGTHEQPFLWHPWLYHYGRNWRVPGDGDYRLEVRIEPAPFGRHDPQNGKRFAEPVTVEFDRVAIRTGQK